MDRPLSGPDSFENEIKTGNRFQFGKNWASFLATLDDERTAEAEKSLKEMLGRDSLFGVRFLDIGSGSGLFSLAARRLGAQVHSFDYDPQSVQCALELKKRLFLDDPQWKIERGSVLDPSYLKNLPKFDIVYSWGVLHHTGEMWQALENALLPLADRGELFIALYNDQGTLSLIWQKIKRLYCSNFLGKLIVSAAFIPYFFLLAVIKSLLCRRNLFRAYKKSRGMSLVHDWYDWLGGYPFEVARPEEVLHFYRKRGLALTNLKTTNGWGNNQFLFSREEARKS